MEDNDQTQWFVKNQLTNWQSGSGRDRYVVYSNLIDGDWPCIRKNPDRSFSVKDQLLSQNDRNTDYRVFI